MIQRIYEAAGLGYCGVGEYNLNIFGIRGSGRDDNTFNDWIGFSCMSEVGEFVRFFRATTDPGRSVLGVRYGGEGGTALLPSSNMTGVKYKFRYGKHKGEYDALVQGEKFLIVRDVDRNGKLLLPVEVEKRLGVSKNEMIGLNIHHSSSVGFSRVVDDWSYGCQVFENIFDYEYFMSVVRRSRARYGDMFSYALFDQKFVEGVVGKSLRAFMRSYI